MTKNQEGLETDESDFGTDSFIDSISFAILQTLRAHAMSCAHRKLRVEILFHRHPLTVAAYFAAPAGDTEKIFKIKQPFEHACKGQARPVVAASTPYRGESNQGMFHT